MLKRFNTRQLIFITLIGVLLFLTELFISGLSGLIVAGSGFLLVAIFWTTIALIGGLTRKKFGTFTLMAFIYGALAIPTTVFGPPGIYKIFLALLTGFSVDLTIFIFNYKKIGYYFGAAIGQIVGLLLFVLAFILFGFPGKLELISSLWFLIPLYGIEGIIGAWIGFMIYNKIKNKSVIKQLQA